MPSRYEKYTTHHTSRRTDDWDYTRPAAYFVTICTADRVCLFGTVERGRMYLNALGKVVAEEWNQSETIRDRVHLDAFVVMPNHLHGIVVFADPDVEAPTCPRHYRAFGEWADDSPDADSGASDGADVPPDSPNGGPASTGGATAPSDPFHSEKASHGGADGSTEPPSDEKASHGGATLGQSESDDDAPDLSRPPQSLGSFVAGFKSAATTRINDRRDTPGAPVWQRNYHDRILRTERHWRAARRYIRRNPADWGGDRHRPDE